MSEQACLGDGVCTNPQCPTHGVEWTAVPQPARTLHESWHEAHPGYPCEYDTCPKGQALDIPAAVPQPADREALRMVLINYGVDVKMDIKGASEMVDAAVDAVLALLGGSGLAGEQEQVER